MIFSNLFSRDQPIWLFWGWCRYIGHSWTNTDISKIFKPILCFIITNIMYSKGHQRGACPQGPCRSPTGLF